MKLSALAVENLPLLHALADASPDATITDVAQAAGRDRSNSSKSLGKLRELGLVGEGLSLSEHGRQLVGLLGPDGAVRAAGGPADVVMLEHGQIEPDPENERQDFESDDAREGLDLLRANIVEHGLIQPLLVSPPEVEGGPYRIIAGERRWRAIGLAISDGDWGADRAEQGQHLIKCVVRAGLSPAQRAFLRLSENLQREDLHALDEGAAYARLVQPPYSIPVDEIAGSLGKSDRHVDNRIKVWLQLPDADKARMRLPRDHDRYLNWRGALSIVQNHRPKPAFDLPAAEGLVVLEMAHRVETKPSRNPHFPAADGWTETPRAPAGDAFTALMRKDLIVSALHERHDGQPDQYFARLVATPDVKGWLAERMAGEWDATLWNARVAALDPISARMAHESGRYATAWLNPDLPPPAAEPVAAAPEPEPTPLHAYTHADVDGDARAATETVSPPQSPTAEVETAPAAPAPPVPTAPREPEASFSDIPDLSEELTGIMVDIVHKVHAEGVEREGLGPCAQVFDYWRFPRSQQLVQLRLVGFTQQGPKWQVYLTPTGRDWMAWNMPPDGRSKPGPYETAWLNPPVATPAEPEAAKPAGPLAPMLQDNFSRQLKEASQGTPAATAMPIPTDPHWEGEETYVAEVAHSVRVAAVRDGHGHGVKSSLRMTLHNQLTGKSLTVRLTPEDAHTLWAELGFIHTRLDGEA